MSKEKESKTKEAKAEKAEKEKENVKKAENKIKGLWGEFKKFISRGNVIDMAVGVVIGGAFSAIVTSVVNVLMSVCTWGVPGGISGLITVLPAANAAQQGLAGVGQSFSTADIVKVTEQYALSTYGITITSGDATFLDYQTQMLNSYNLYGTTYVYSGAAIINWGAIINAVISFLIIAIVLFTVLKIVKGIRTKTTEAAEKIKETIAHEKAKEEAKAEDKKAE